MAGEFVSYRSGSSSIKFILFFDRVAATNINLCLDDLQSSSDDPYNLGVYVCHRPNVTKSQFFTLTNEGLFRSEEACATVQKRYEFINPLTTVYHIEAI